MVGVGSFESLWLSYLISVAHEEELVTTIRHLGTQTIRAKRLIALSKSYVREPPSTYDLRPSKRADLSSPNKKVSRFFEDTKRSSYPATPSLISQELVRTPWFYRIFVPSTTIQPLKNGSGEANRQRANSLSGMLWRIPLSNTLRLARFLGP